jgi:hypothetical protein
MLSYPVEGITMLGGEQAQLTEAQAVPEGQITLKIVGSILLTMRRQRKMAALVKQNMFVNQLHPFFPFLIVVFSLIKKCFFFQIFMFQLV